MHVGGFYHWATVCVVIVLSTIGSTGGKLLRCACNTQHCRSTGTRSCTTQYKCYKQYLERSDGASPLTNGCISGNTPLLCENRLPAITHTKWPYLLCCDTGDLCNSGGLSSGPPWREPLHGGGGGGGNVSVVHPGGDQHHVMTSLGHSVVNQPVVMAVLVIGVVLLVAIMGFGFYVLKKQSIYLQQVSLRNGYTKADDVTPTLDTPEPTSV